MQAPIMIISLAIPTRKKMIRYCMAMPGYMKPPRKNEELNTLKPTLTTTTMKTKGPPMTRPKLMNPLVNTMKQSKAKERTKHPRTSTEKVERPNVLQTALVRIPLTSSMRLGVMAKLQADHGRRMATMSGPLQLLT